jgi:protein-disulfide isomerase
MSKRQGTQERSPETGASPPPRGVDSLGLATLGGVVVLLMISFASWRDVSRIDRDLGERLGRLEAQVTQVAGRLDRLPAQAAQAPRGPDPDRVYTVQTAAAPVRGPAGAPVTIAEFSDFQ